MLITPDRALEIAEVQTFYVAKMIQQPCTALTQFNISMWFLHWSYLEILASLQQYCTTYTMLVGTSSLQILQYILMDKIVNFSSLG